MTLLLMSVQKISLVHLIVEYMLSERTYSCFLTVTKFIKSNLVAKFFRYNIYELICFPSKGLNNLTFSSLREFLYWKEREEEATYSMYIKSQQTYYPSSSGMLYHA